MKTSLVDDTRTDPPVPSWFEGARHVQDIVGAEEIFEDRELWRRYYKERLKTVSYAVVMCLNLGVEPPDMMRKQLQGGKLECWVDPQGMSPQKAVQQIIKNIQSTYERWQPRARFKIATDPTVEEVRRLCQGMRRNAKDERVLFHYNGHGVPRPTENGELWVFNKSFTQYIPLSIYDLQTWICNPSVYVWDCNAAGLIVKSFSRFAGDQEKEWVKQLDEHMETKPPPLPMIQASMSLEQRATAFGFPKKPNFRDCIHLAACAEDEFLPIDPDLPADLFTSCLTTPIKTSILWHILKNGLKDSFPLSNLDRIIPGEISDRRSILGELNWIFTAITDTIAWDALSKELFQKIFRLDLVLASLCRSFLLADRIMLANNRHVVSEPKLPSLHDHPLWDAWDFTLDHCLDRIRGVALQNSNALWNLGKELHFTRTSLRYNVLIEMSSDWYKAEKENGLPLNWFFKDQLRAFDMWLKYGADKHIPPQQLPVVLQVLLSQQYRVEALKLLARFLDLGAWAVGHALTVGIFPYMLKLLQSGLKDLRPWLAFIWAKILAVEPNCQSDLVKDKDQGYLYFITILNDISVSPWQKIASAFVTAAIIHNDYRPAQDVLSSNGYISICVELLSGSAIEKCRLLRLWVLIGLGRLWSGHNEARWQAIRLVAHDRVMDCLNNPVPEIRAAAMYALGCLVRNRSEYNEHAASVDHEICERIATKCMYEGSVLVRAELVVALQWFIIDFEQHFANMYLELAKKVSERRVLRKITMEDRIAADRLSDRRPTRRINHGRKLSVGENENSRIPEDQPFNNYSTLPRDFLKQQQQPYRRQIQGVPQRSNSMVLGPLPEHDDSHSPQDAPKKKTKRAEEIFRERVLEQVQVLKDQLMMSQAEKVWYAVLWLSLDPVKKVAEMARVLVLYVEKVAALKKERFSNICRQPTTSFSASSEKVDERVRSPERPTFTIGSPTTSAMERAASMFGDPRIAPVLQVADVQSPPTRVRVIHPMPTDAFNEKAIPRANVSKAKGPQVTVPKLVKDQRKTEVVASTSAPVEGPLTRQVDEEQKPVRANLPKREEGNLLVIEPDVLALQPSPPLQVSPAVGGEVMRNANVNSEIKKKDANSDCGAGTRVIKNEMGVANYTTSAARESRPTFTIASLAEPSSLSPAFDNAQEEHIPPALGHPTDVTGADSSDWKESSIPISAPENVDANSADDILLRTDHKNGAAPKLNKSEKASADLKMKHDSYGDSVKRSTVPRKTSEKGMSSSMTTMAKEATPSLLRPVSAGASASKKKGQSRKESNVAKSVPDVAIEAPVVVIEGPDTGSEPSAIAVEAIDAIEEFAEEDKPTTVSFGMPSVSGTESSTAPKNSAPHSSSAGAAPARKTTRISRHDTPTAPIFHTSSIFTPKRKVHAPSMNSMVRLDEFGTKQKEPLAPLITTEFIPWCSKRFTDPLLDVIEKKVDDGLSEHLCIQKLPSDWAYYKREVLLANAGEELQILQKATGPHCDSQLFLAKTERPTTNLAWSALRPHLYTSDGKDLDVWRYELQKTTLIRRINCADCNPYCYDTVCHVEVLNELTRELLLTGSTDGLVRIWDPGYSIHSSEFEKDPRLVSAAFLLKDETRYSEKHKTVYGWNQLRGFVIASGDVGVCRFWDVVTERKYLDLKIVPKLLNKARKPVVTKICADKFNPDLHCLGLNDGMIYYYDLRLPIGGKQRVMSLFGLKNPVVGLSIFSDPAQNGNVLIVAGASNGAVRIWDPRMYEEPLAEFNVFRAETSKDCKMVTMDMQNHGKLISCATTASEALVYDINGKLRGEIKYDDALIGGRLGAPCAVRFHPLRVMVAVSTEERAVSAYGLPHTVL